ncbi:PREDICTED: formimidoyltransferase-cyclodeaminase-like [Acropora digitifera]|uniref:formimidoyltransferase-cyclodeaminase-like n=1 Tax=Acropora digitifera TaxID=70779 RepID=UPI00077B2159|nr:PREDICTED: formimidoyltransferase-cyclodeaminase-like [Acropora digitifera]
MPKIVECVPNFSEGRNKEVIDAIAQAIAVVDGCSLLDVDPGTSTNRTVYTFVGSPESVVEGALNGARCALQLIDMRSHHGTKDSFKLSFVVFFAVYLYGYASEREYRKTVPQIRAGEYEGLSEKIKKEEWKPDYGPAEFLPSWGATIAGARKFLIAYNINILGTKEQAHRLALNLRTQGRGADKPGRLQEVQGMGWYLDEANLAQVSLNLLDYEKTNVQTAFEECSKNAKVICQDAFKSLNPDQYLFAQRKSQVECLDMCSLSVTERLGLSSVTPFDPKTRIIEYLVGGADDGPLVSLPLRQFIYSLGSRSSAPGGGSASAAIAAMGVALATMVGWLTYGNKKFESLDSQMRCLIPPLRQAMLDFIPMIDADTNAFSGFMEAKKLPKTTPEEEEIREKALQEGLRDAVQVPLQVIRTATKVWKPMLELAEVGNVNSKSDLQVLQ